MIAKQKEQTLDLREELQDREAEEALVGAVLINPASLDDPAIMSIRPNYFYIDRLGWIWKACGDLLRKGKDVDLITVAAVLKRRKQLESIGGQSYLTQLVNAAPSSLSVASYADVVKSLALRRTIYDEGVEMVKAANSQKSPERVLDQVHDDIGELRLAYLGSDGYMPLEWSELAGVIPKIRWLQPRWIPRGYISLVVGAPDIGKSSYALTLTRSVTVGGSWPDGTLTKRIGKVCWLDSESTQAINLERAEWFGVPVESVVAPAIGHDAFSDVTLTTPEGWLAFEMGCRTEGVEMAVVDSLGGASLEENKSEVKAIMRRLARLALELDIGMVVIHHPRKLGLAEHDVITLDRIRGHSSIAQFARSILAIERPDPASDSVRVRSIKNNFGTKPDPIGFEWADNMLAFGSAPEEPKTETLKDQAIDLIQVLLKDGPMLATEIYEQANGAGISERTMKRAKKALSIPGKRVGNKWYWALPSHDQEEPWWIDL